MGAPAHTPPDIIAALNKAINTALSDAAVKQRFADLGAVPMIMTPAEFGQFMADEAKKWGKVVKDAHIKVE
jgi:tripartite-type tricarboxylate transporter receptor subunit TctC